MKPIRQTRFGKKGDCYAACLASILELPLSAVPEWHVGTCSWVVAMQRWQAWLAERGLGLLAVQACDPDLLHVLPTGWCIVSGKAERGLSHSVVGRVVRENGEMEKLVLLWDPHPSDAFLLENARDDWTLDFFVVLNPSKKGGDDAG